MAIESFPLYWPEGRERVEAVDREKKWAFTGTFDQYRADLMHELELLGAENIILSTNIPLRKDGMPYATAKEPADPGVAVYFIYQGDQVCFAADKYITVRENIRAIGLTINALRGIERWGTGDMLKRAFRGFVALPEPPEHDWREVLGFAPGFRPTAEQIEAAYKRKAVEHHPDKEGGSHEKFIEVQSARKKAQDEITRKG